MVVKPISMTADEFRLELERLNVNQVTAARLLGVNERTIRRWVAGKPIPLSTKLLLAKIEPPVPEPPPLPAIREEQHGYREIMRPMRTPHPKSVDRAPPTHAIRGHRKS